MAGERFHVYVGIDFWTASGEDAQAEINALNQKLNDDWTRAAQILFVPEGRPEPLPDAPGPDPVPPPEVPAEG